jgi:hypothetical protein
MKSILKRSMSYAKMFRLMEGLIFAPLMGLAGQVLRGRVVLDSTALVGFFLSPMGLFALFFGAVSFLMIRVMEQAGLSVLRAEEFGGAVHTPVSALKFVLSRIFPLLRAACRFIFLGGLILTPFLIVTGLIARYFLSRHDINFYLAERPADFRVAAIVIAIVALVTLAVLVWNMVRWRWVVNVILFENTTGGAAFKRSVQLVKGTALKIAVQWAGIGVLNVALGIVAAWTGRLLLPLGANFFGGIHHVAWRVGGVPAGSSGAHRRGDFGLGAHCGGADFHARVFSTVRAKIVRKNGYAVKKFLKGDLVVDAGGDHAVASGRWRRGWRYLGDASVVNRASRKNYRASWGGRNRPGKFRAGV